MRGTALAAASLLTVMRTNSDPALASSAHWLAVRETSAVSVLVMDCTMMGASPPTTTWLMATGTDVRRLLMGVMVMVRGYTSVERARILADFATNWAHLAL